MKPLVTDEAQCLVQRQCSLVCYFCLQYYLKYNKQKRKKKEKGFWGGEGEGREREGREEGGEGEIPRQHFRESFCESLHEQAENLHKLLEGKKERDGEDGGREKGEEEYLFPVSCVVDERRACQCTPVS